MIQNLMTGEKESWRPTSVRNDTRPLHNVLEASERAERRNHQVAGSKARNRHIDLEKSGRNYSGKTELT